MPLTKRETKRAECRPNSNVLWTETKSWFIKTPKRKRLNSSHLDRTRLINEGYIIEQNNIN